MKARVWYRHLHLQTLGRIWVGVLLIGYVESVAFRVLHGGMEGNVLLTGCFHILLNETSAIVACYVGNTPHALVNICFVS